MLICFVFIRIGHCPSIAAQTQSTSSKTCSISKILVCEAAYFWMLTCQPYTHKQPSSWTDDIEHDLYIRAEASEIPNHAVSRERMPDMSGVHGLHGCRSYLSP